MLDAGVDQEGQRDVSSRLLSKLMGKRYSFFFLWDVNRGSEPRDACRNLNQDRGKQRRTEETPGLKTSVEFLDLATPESCMNLSVLPLNIFSLWPNSI